MEIADVTTGDVTALLRTPMTLVDLSLAVRAHTLASAATFTDLLSPQSLAGVDAHTYQHDTVRRVLRVLRGRALLADEVGLGKTVEAILVLREYQLRGMARRTLVIAPPALVPQWRGELLAKAGVQAATLDDHAFEQDPAAFLARDGVVLASLAKARGAKVAPLLQSASWDLVVVDEAHHIKKQSTLGYKLVDGLKSRFLLLLTATPIETSLEELYALVTLLRPGQLTTASAFKAQFVDKSDPTSPKNRERLRQLLGDVMVRNTRAACGLKLPPRFVTTAVVEPLAAERALYDRVVDLVRADAQAARRTLLGTTLLLEAGSSPDAVRATLDRATALDGPAFAAAREAARAATQTKKLEQLVALVRAHGGHALVFTRFRATLAAIERAFNDAGVRHVVVSGAQSADEKALAVERFREERCALVSTDVGAEGTNLQHCNVVVSFDVPWNPMLLEQRIGRVHRMGQTRDVHVYNLAMKGSAEEKLLDVLDRRLHLFELVVGEMDMVLGNLADDRDLEERVLALYAASKDEAEIDRGFDALAAEIGAARGTYEDSKKLDDAVFGEDFAA